MSVSLEKASTIPFTQNSETEQRGGSKICKYGVYVKDGTETQAVLLVKRVTENQERNDRIQKFFAKEVQTLIWLSTHFPDNPYTVQQLHIDADRLVLKRCKIDMLEMLKLGVNPITNQCITNLDRLKFALQCVEAVQYLHSKKVVHKDVKPDNLLLNLSLGRLQLCDFAYCANFEDPFVLALVGTINYIAPEILYSKGHHHRHLPSDTLVTALDAWSLGQTLTLLYYRHIASVFLEIKGEEIPHLTRYTNIVNFCEKNPSYDLYGLLDIDPCERASLEQVAKTITRLIARANPLNTNLKSENLNDLHYFKINF